MPATLIKCGLVECKRHFYPRQLTEIETKKKTYYLCPNCLKELNEILQSKEKLDIICRRFQTLGEQDKNALKEALVMLKTILILRTEIWMK